jgi:hypothetical protein
MPKKEGNCGWGVSGSSDTKCCERADRAKQSWRCETEEKFGVESRDRELGMEIVVEALQNKIVGRALRHGDG